MADCVFCVNEPIRVIFESDRFVARLDQYPLSRGHTLVVPRRHVVSLFDLTPDEVAEAYELLAAARAFINDLHTPAGYNVGVNDGRAAGRTVDHLHIHLIPRYLDDVPDPRGGIRNMLPGPSPDTWSTSG